MFTCICKKVFDTKNSLTGHKANCKEFQEYINSILSYDFLYENLITNDFCANYVSTDILKNNVISAAMIINRARKLGIKTKSLKESNNNKHSLTKKELTCLKKYGAKNCLSKNTIPYLKRNKTVKIRYDCDNVFQSNDIKDIMDLSYITKYGITKNKHKSFEMKKVWENLTDDQKNIWLEKSLHSKKGKENWRLRGCYTSKLEYKIIEILNNECIPFQHNFYIKRTNEPKKWYFYDFRLINTNILIEIQGDYWHANPKKYKENDLIFYKKGDMYAKDIWLKDYKKKITAEESGFTVIYIWEDEIINHKHNLFEYVRGKINENIINPKN